MTVRQATTLRLAEDGAELHARAAARVLPDLHAALAHLPTDQPGLRLRDMPALHGLLGSAGSLGSIAAQSLGPVSRPVRAILFDKTAQTNWALGWHQDRTICVEDRRDVAGFGPWSMKQGMQHVEPPFALLERMLTMRVHLDAVPASNAPLVIAPGSHLFGRLAEQAIVDVVARCGSIACEADAGDVWLYSTPILHASAAATEPASRRVLQVDFSRDDLPGGLAWRGI